MKALLLAAGYGTRLKPMTDHVPKPLTLFMGQPILDLAYKKVEAAGVTAVAVNTHHLPQKIAVHIQNSALYKLPTHISFEPTILGTGGCINPLRNWLDEEDLLIFNGDIVCSIDLKRMIEKYQGKSHVAAMALIPHREGTTPVYVRDQQVVSIGEPVLDAEKKTFSGIHILSPAFVAEMPHEGFYSVIDCYRELLKRREPVLAFEHEGYWADLGIPKDYLEAHLELLKAKDRKLLTRELGLTETAWTFDAESQSFFGDSPVLAGFRNSFVFGPITVDQPVQIESCIVYPHSHLTQHSQETGRILSPYACLDMLNK